MDKTNDDKIKSYQRKKVLKWIIIVLSLLVIVLEVLALLDIINMLWGCLVFIIIYILKKMF